MKYGRFFGKKYMFQDVVESAPRVRVRQARDRAKDQLADLAVLNSRLAGDDEARVIQTRQKLDYLKNQRHNWELVFQMITTQDAQCTLDLIEEASAKAEALLSEPKKETTGIGDMEDLLKQLEKEVQEAQLKLEKTQERVRENRERVEVLRRETAALEAEAAAAAAAASLVEKNKKTSNNTTTDSTSQLKNYSERELIQEAIERRRQRGLYSSLDLEPGLLNHWFPVSFSSKLSSSDTLHPIELFGEQWVLFRDTQGRVACLRDECAHRACPLSLGRVVGGEVECSYHGWRFDGGGECKRMPSTVLCRGISVHALPCEEKDGFIWVWPGILEEEGGTIDGTTITTTTSGGTSFSYPPLPVPSCTAPPPGYDIHTELELEVPVEHGLLIENLLDLAHAPFTHTSTFARGWPVPELVKFHAGKMMAGDWDPYPIRMGFEPPCITISTIGLKRPGGIERGGTAEGSTKHLHQLHVCLPTSKGKTRLLYRMSMDFLGWARYVPGVQSLWKSVAEQVLSEDLKLVVGQQERMKRGGDTWANPVSYDKLAVRYRRWRNSTANSTMASSSSSSAGSPSSSSSSVVEGALPSAAAGCSGGGVLLATTRLHQEALSSGLRMSADELFQIEEQELAKEECELYVDEPCELE
jgi:chlorophyllide a oxygenase